MAGKPRHLTPDDPRHGTYAGAQAHRREHQEPCEPCRVARAAYYAEKDRKRDAEPPKPRVQCSICGKQTPRESGLCYDCQRLVDSPDGIGLENGSWVPGRHGILRWVAA